MGDVGALSWHPLQCDCRKTDGICEAQTIVMMPSLVIPVVLIRNVVVIPVALQAR